MGQLGKQSTYGFLSSYVGMLLGIVNKLLLFPIVFKNDSEYWGLIELFVAIGTIIASVGHLGMPFVLRRFLPGEENSKAQLIGFTLVVSVLGCVAIMLGMWFFQDAIIQFNTAENDVTLLRSFYPLLILLVAAMLFDDFFGAVMTSYYKAHIPLFLNNVVFRFGVILLIGCYYLFHFSLDTFVYLYIGIYFLLPVLSIIYLLKKKMLAIKANLTLPERNAYTQYGLYSVMSGSSSWIVNYMDAVFVAKYLALNAVPILALSKNIVNVMHVPARALVAASIPLVSKAWKENDKNQLQIIYKKTAIAEFLVGGLIFLAIWINLDFLLAILPGRDWSIAKWIILVLGLGLLADLSAGANMSIMTYSPHYKYFLAGNVLVMVIAICLNIWLTPILGLMGAALALSLGITINNVIMVWLLWWKEKIQPYTKMHLVILLFFVGIAGVLYIDLFSHVLLNLLVKNIVFGATAAYLVLIVKPLPEINSFILFAINKLKNTMGKQKNDMFKR